MGVVGVQQGAETDLLAYFIARKFGLDRYGMILAGCRPRAGPRPSGILLFGRIHDVTGSYALPAYGVFAYALGAVMISSIQLPRLTPRHCRFGRCLGPSAAFSIRSSVADACRAGNLVAVRSVT